MLVCESCGSENPDDVHFCVMCGAFLSKPVPSGSARELPAPDAPQPELREPRLEPFQPPRLDDQRSAPAAAPPPAPAAPVDPPDDAAAPPPWFRRTGVATRAAAPSQDLPTLADAPPFDPSAPERTDGLPGLAPAPPGLTARPPQRGQPARPAPPAPSRPQQALAVMLDQSVIDVQPGATASFRVAVRNTGALVEGCTVSVRGIPAAWQRMEPDRFNLDVDQQTDVQVHITPPRSPKTTAGRTALAIVVRSEVNEEIQQRGDATLVIEPYVDLTTTLEPVEIEGKRGGYTYVNVENRGNKTERVAFTGTEPGKRLRFTFRPAELEVRPGQRGSVGVDVRARRRLWGGGEKSRPFTVALTGGDRPPPPMQGRFAQLPSWPRWVIPVIAAVLAIAIPTTLVLVNRSLDKSEANALISVPKVVDLTADAAKQTLGQKQLVATVHNVYRSGDPGMVVDQNPPPGQKVEKNTPIKIDVSTDRLVPNLVGKPYTVAKEALAREEMTLALGQDDTSGKGEENTIAWQLPDGGQPAPDGVVTVGVYRTAKLRLLDYRGLDQISAQTDLTNAGLKPIIQEEGSDKPKGTVLDQYPGAGQELKEGDSVTLLVSSGHPPDPTSTSFNPASSAPSSPPSS